MILFFISGKAFSFTGNYMHIASLTTITRGGEFTFGDFLIYSASICNPFPMQKESNQYFSTRIDEEQFWV
mgnify:CR=1 FL=1